MRIPLLRSEVARPAEDVMDVDRPCLTPLAAASFEEWLAAARAGSPGALGEVFEACRNYLLMIANRELDADLQAKGGASDLVQETFLEAQQAFDRFRGATEAELLDWLGVILRHNVANFRRRYDADRRAVAREVPLDGAAAGQAAAGPSPSSLAAAGEQVTALDRALGRLPAHYLQVIHWRHRDHLSFEEIGRRLDRSADAARMLWGRAVAQLQKELQRP
jgi:RNA polymerase sigma-70 factor (ECF subfamily)